ncbi:hypothetical protein V6N12_062374 [Hibiscus sabdariffa]|uniref:Uncharacterized protein n=1 Tax=Hibiscus sabdariffa TaxID=183260 RepID=A0ABR2F8N3_9ROSI
MRKRGISRLVRVFNGEARVAVIITITSDDVIPPLPLGRQYGLVGLLAAVQLLGSQEWLLGFSGQWSSLGHLPFVAWARSGHDVPSSSEVGRLCGGGLGVEEGSKRWKLKAKETDEGIVEFLCLFHELKLSGFNLLQLAPQLENVDWQSLFRTSRWWSRCSAQSCWAWLSSGRCRGFCLLRCWWGWHDHLDRCGICNLHLPHVFFSCPARLLDSILVSWAGRYNSSSAESIDDAGKCEDTFVILAGC